MSRAAHRFIIQSLVFFAMSSIVATANSHAARVSDELYDRMVARLCQHYAANATATLPEKISIKFDHETPESLFKVFKHIWVMGHPDFLAEKKLLHKIAKGKTLTAEELDALRLTRARFKQLRFAYGSFEKDHEYPKQLDDFTAEMGHLQDALSNGQDAEAKRIARKLFPQWNQETLDRLKVEIHAFEPSSKHSFYHWIDKELDQLDSLLDMETLTVKKVHNARKILARQNAVYFVLDARHSDPNTKAVLDYLSSMNAKFGDFHDKLVTQEKNGELAPDAQVAIPEDLKAPARVYMDKMREFLSSLSGS
jgi:hypothetical protein